ncbi:MAG: ribose-phosphate pyrophosphokinase [Candidatus Brocadiia bacterium]
MKTSMVVISGSSNLPLSKGICSYLGIPLGNAEVSRFPDGEIKVVIQQDVRGLDVFIIQPTCHPVNESVMELLIMIDALRRASADRITAVIPYYGYARQDRKHEGRVPISAKLVANLLISAGANRILAMDLHASQIQGFFDIPCDHLSGVVVFAPIFKTFDRHNTVVMSPDIGSIKIARDFGDRLGMALAVIDKRRDFDGQIEMPHIIGSVEGKTVLLVDDMITTGGTLCMAATALKSAGAKEIICAATHPVLVGSCIEKINASAIDRVYVTDTIQLGAKAALLPKCEVVSVAPLLGESIRRIHSNESVSWLFKNMVR